MGRPRKHLDNADKARAYRARRKEKTMTDEQKYEKLKAYVREMAKQHNELEERVNELESKMRMVQADPALSMPRERVDALETAGG